MEKHINALMEVLPFQLRGQEMFLLGLIGSFLAQGLSKIDAARFSVAIHGAAGDRFSKNKRVRGLTATKLIKIINEEML